MESTIGLFKTGLIKPGRPWKTLSQVELATAEWIDWYCHRRLHGEIGHVPPVEYETNHYMKSTKPKVNRNLRSLPNPGRFMIDCPGNLGLIVVNAIVASDEVIACVKPGWKELRALTRMEAKIDEIRDTFEVTGAAAELSNILIVDCPTTRNQGAVYDDSQQQAKEAYEDLVLPTVRRSPRTPRRTPHKRCSASTIRQLRTRRS